MRKIVIRWFVGAILGVAAIVGVGRYAGGQLGEDIKPRLVTVWPDFMVMAEGDKRLVLNLALECDLQAKADSPAETIACLRSAAVADVHAAAQLEKMLEAGASVRNDARAP